MIYLLSFVETPRKFIIAIINLRGVSTKVNKYIVFTMQTYKKNINDVYVFIAISKRPSCEKMNHDNQSFKNVN